MNPAIIVSFILFQVGWFACVLGAAYGIEWAGYLVAFLVVGLHVVTSKKWQHTALLTLLAGGIGLIAETLLAQTNWLIYIGHRITENGTTWWLVSMWMLFGAVMHTAFQWLKGRYVLAAVLGAVAGPLAYRGGAALGALDFNHELYGLLAIGAVWLFAMPLLVALLARFDGAK